jgi:hypothetical protein
MKSLITFLFICSVVSHANLFDNAYAADEEQVTFYPTYGYKEGDNWVIPMRIWVHERRALVEELIRKVATSIGDLDSKEIANFRSRIQDFVVDSESRETVTFKFDNDPENQEYGSPRDFPQTDLNGLVEKGVIRIPITKAKELLSRQGSQNGWLTYRATSKEHSGIGRVQLIESTGISVVSDIDDTIKITEIPAGSKVVSEIHSSAILWPRLKWRRCIRDGLGLHFITFREVLGNCTDRSPNFSSVKKGGSLKALFT